MAEITDLVLVFPPGGWEGPRFRTTLGAAYILAFLQEKGFTALPFLSSMALSARECAGNILAHHPAMVGFTVYVTNYAYASLIARALKQTAPDLPILFGGPLATVTSREILQTNPHVDICVKGEAEETMVDLLALQREYPGTIPESDGLIRVPGIAFREGNHVTATQGRESPHFSPEQERASLDRYPSPYLSGAVPLSEAPHMGILTARGCNQSCVFCNCAALSNHKVFFHSEDRVLSELDIISRLGWFEEPIPIHDDTFSLFPQRAEAICRGIIRERIRLPLSATTRADRVSEDLLQLMKEAGFTAIAFGLESACPRVLRRIGKIRPPETTRDTGLEAEKGFIEKVAHYVSFARKIGMKQVGVSVMVGLPYETLDEARDTIAFVDRLPVDFYHYNLLNIYPGTPLYAGYKEYGYRFIPREAHPVPKTRHPHPVDRAIHPGAKARLVQVDKARDWSTAKAFSFYSEPSGTPRSSFLRVLLARDEINDDLLPWLEQNMALHGRLILVFSSREAFLERRKEVAALLESRWIPSIHHEAYFFEEAPEGWGRMMVPVRMLLRNNPDDGAGIHFMETSLFLRKTAEGARAVSPTVCTETHRSDALALLRLLERKGRQPDPLASVHAIANPAAFQGLCKWLRNGANCTTFETALIDSDGSIRLCPHALPSGTIENSHREVLNRFRKQADMEIQKRACGDCSMGPDCMRCPFPFPLPGEAYCEERKSLGSRPASEFFRVAGF